MALPVLLGPDDGERRQARGSVMVFKALAATTGGRFSLMERSLPPGARMPPPHRHVDCEEAFYVLEGEITFVLDGVEHVRGPGDFVLVPGGGSHTFGNRSAAPARACSSCTPRRWIATLPSSSSCGPVPRRQRWRKSSG